MQRTPIPDRFAVPRQKLAGTIPWFTALSIAAIIVGATLALAGINH